MLVAILVLTSCQALAQAPGVEDGMTRVTRPERVVDTIGLQRGTEITVGSTTPLSGAFGTNLMVGTTSDMDVRHLLEGYTTIATTRTQEMVFDGTAVQSVDTKQEQNGDRTYTIELAEGLTYNDGSPITSKDYLFTLLLSTSPLLRKLGLSALGFDHLVGMEAYKNGETNVLEGARYVSDTVFTLRVSGEFLPYFYGMQMLNITPYPYAVIAPGCDIIDTEQGVQIGFGSDAATMDATRGYTPGVFDEAMLRETLLNRETGYIFNPKITAGPYYLESYDRATGKASFSVNERYQGNYEGQKPHIEKIHFMRVWNGTMIDELRSGTVQLLNKVANIGPVTEGLELADRERLAGKDVYPRTGLAMLSFACEQGPTQYESVRRAIARCVDREELVKATLGEANGIPVYAYYGMGQWMINTSFPAEPENDKEALVVQDAVNSLKFSCGIAEAKQELVDGGWTLNESGEPFVEGVDSVRYLNEQGLSVPLEIKWAIPSESQVADILKGMLAEAFVELGIGLEITEMPFEDLLPYYYRETERTYDMFFLASNFGNVFDPYFDFNTADEYQGQLNTTGLRDEGLMELSVAMRVTNPSETRAYVDSWIAFQRRFVEVMPVAPLYSNVYFDFFPRDLQDYNIAQHSNWGSAISYAWFGDSPVEEDNPLEVLDLGQGAGEAPEVSPPPV